MYHHHCLGIHRANPSTLVTIVILMVLWLLFHFPSLHPLQQQQEQQQQHIDASTMIKGETNLPLPSASEISSGSDAVNPNHPLAKIALVHAGIHKVSISRLNFKTNSFRLLSSSLFCFSRRAPPPYNNFQKYTSTS